MTASTIIPTLATQYKYFLKLGFWEINMLTEVDPYPTGLFQTESKSSYF